MSLTLIYLLKDLFELRTDIQTICASNGRVNMVDKEAIDLLDHMGDVWVEFVHVKSIGH